MSSIGKQAFLTVKCYSNSLYQSATVCELCPAGSQCDDPAMAPQLCLVGTYSNNGSISCPPCSRGYECQVFTHFEVFLIFVEELYSTCIHRSEKRLQLQLNLFVPAANGATARPPMTAHLELTTIKQDQKVLKIACHVLRVIVAKTQRL